MGWKEHLKHVFSAHVLYPTVCLQKKRGAFLLLNQSYEKTFLPTSALNLSSPVSTALFLLEIFHVII